MLGIGITPSRGRRSGNVVQGPVVVIQPGGGGATPLLNLYPNAAAAYSTRLLRTEYTGAALRVRRSNDNAEQDIGFDASGNLNESALTTFVGTNSAFVTTWYDQSGNARNATQATAANQPRIVNAGVVDKVNGRVSAVSVLGGSNGTSLRSVLFGIPQAYTGFGAAVAPNGATFFDCGQTSAASTIYRTATGAFAIESPNTISSAVLPDGLCSVSGLFSGANSNLYRNNSLIASGNAGANGLNSGVSIFSNRAGASTLSVVGTQTAEIILYPSDQSANRAAIESNIMSYFGITA
jgi:hypothetical protein